MTIWQFGVIGIIIGLAICVCEFILSAIVDKNTNSARDNVNITVLCLILGILVGVIWNLPAVMR